VEAGYYRKRDDLPLIDSKSGDIDIKLHVGGLGEEHANKALLDVRSRTGKVPVKLIGLSGVRRVYLDVATGKGSSRQRQYLGSNPTKHHR
jgi:hypothetical protein